ncbi:MAG: hypothetical protein ACJAZ3_001069 [Sphingobacteriales bacterium]|jgi:hypothetical protein
MKKIAALVVLFIVVGSCKKDGTGVNLFSIQDDKDLGLQVKGQIESDPSMFPIADRATYPEAYAFLDSIRDVVLASDDIIYRDDFAWEVYIIADDSTLNAFATPGGYIYFYTGLMKFLDNSHALAGVMGHELAHSDRRHSTNQLTKQYGLSTLASAILGDSNILADVTTGLIGLEFTRKHETEADEFSVKYLCESDYEASGAAEFFDKIGGSSGTPTFLSTHPNSEDRITNIRALDSTLACTGSVTQEARYAQFKASLP